jgi:hypothetical protein
MKATPLTLLLLLTATPAKSAEVEATHYPRVIFADDFSGTDFDKRWGHYKSGSVVRDGVLVGITPENSDHAAVDNIRFDGEKDLEVSVRFRFVSEKAKGFNVWLDDKNYKNSHAGHICSVTVTPATLTMSDAKTGNFQNDIYEKKKTPEGLTPEQKAMLATKTRRVQVTVSQGDWHTLLVRTKDDEVSVQLDGGPFETFKSEGIAHVSKTLVSLTTNLLDVHYDDFCVRGVAKP